MLPVVEPIVATVMSLLTQMPPGVVLLSEEVEPVQMDNGPVIGVGLNNMFIVTVTLQVPPIVYVIVADPGLTPITLPVDEPICAREVLLLDHVPPPELTRLVESY